MLNRREFIASAVAGLALGSVGAKLTTAAPAGFVTCEMPQALPIVAYSAHGSEIFRVTADGICEFFVSPNDVFVKLKEIFPALRAGGTLAICAKGGVVVSVNSDGDWKCEHPPVYVFSDGRRLQG